MKSGGGFSNTDSGPKESKELFVGNLNTSAPGVIVTPEMIMTFMNNAMRQVGLVSSSNDPITGCRVNTKFCFIEFSNVIDCSNAMNLNGLPFLGNCLNIKRPAKYAGEDLPHKSWQEMTGMVAPDDPTMRDRPTGGNIDLLIQDATKAEREIYIGGTQSDITDYLLKEFLSNALQKMGLTISSTGSPIVQVRVNTTFCFVVFRSREEAANVLNLNGIPFNNMPLKISRPAKLNMGGLYQSYNWNELLANWQTGHVKLMTSGPPTKVVRLTNMITAVELSDPMQHKEVLDDVSTECSNFGRVVGAVAPRPTDGPSSSGIGQVFVEMSTEEQAKQVLCALKGRMFDGRIVDAKFYPYEFYMLGNYGLILPTLVVTKSGPVTVDMALMPPGSQPSIPVVPMGLPMAPMAPMGQPMMIPPPRLPTQPPFPRPFH